MGEIKNRIWGNYGIARIVIENVHKELKEKIDIKDLIFTYKEEQYCFKYKRKIININNNYIQREDYFYIEDEQINEIVQELIKKLRS